MTKQELIIEKLTLQKENLEIMNQFSQDILGIRFHTNNNRISAITMEINELETAEKLLASPNKADALANGKLSEQDVVAVLQTPVAQ